MPGHIKVPPGRSGTTGTNPAFTPKTGTTGTNPVHKPAPVEPTGKADGFAQTSPQVHQAQLTGQEAVRAPEQLTSHVATVKDPQQLPRRLTADLAVHLPQLTQLLNLTRQDKASRLVAFLVPYAARLAELTPRMPQAERSNLEGQMLEAMKSVGLVHVVEMVTGKSGVQVAAELLSMKTPEDARGLTGPMRFDAPNWPSAPEHTATMPNAEAKRGEPMLIAQPNVHPMRERKPEGKGGEEPLAEYTDKKLGKNMMWNLLHRFRGSGGTDDEVQTRKDREQIEAGLVTIGLISLFLALALAAAFAIMR